MKNAAALACSQEGGRRQGVQLVDQLPLDALDCLQQVGDVGLVGLLLHNLCTSTCRNESGTVAWEIDDTARWQSP